MSISSRPPRRSSPPASSSFRRLEVVGSGHWRAPQPSSKPEPRIIAVGGARAGVGKSTVAANLAIAVAERGNQVVLVDLDLSSPCQHLLFGARRPVSGLKALLDREIANLDVALTRTDTRNLYLVTGGGASSGVPALALDREEKRFLMRQIREIDSDVIVVDVGADNRDDLLDFFSLGALRLIVTTPDAAAFEASYGFVRNAALRAVRHFGGAQTQEALRSFGVRLVGNRGRTLDEMESFHAFSRLVADFLGFPLPVLACLHTNDGGGRGTQRHRPLLSGSGIDANVRAFHLMAETLMAESVPALACDLEGATSVAGSAAPLPADLSAYRRRHPRHEVDWIATLQSSGRDIAVRVVDISMGGAGLEVVSELQLGESATLFFEQLPGRPAMPVVVKSLRGAVRRAGVAFDPTEALPGPLVAAAAAQSGARTRGAATPH